MRSAAMTALAGAAGAVASDSLGFFNNLDLLNRGGCGELDGCRSADRGSFVPDRNTFFFPGQNFEQRNFLDLFRRDSREDESFGRADFDFQEDNVVFDFNNFDRGSERFDFRREDISFEEVEVFLSVNERRSDRSFGNNNGFCNQGERDNFRCQIPFRELVEGGDFNDMCPINELGGFMIFARIRIVIRIREERIELFNRNFNNREEDFSEFSYACSECRYDDFERDCNRRDNFREEIVIEEDFRIQDCRNNFRNRGFNNFDECRNNYDNRNRFREEIFIEEEVRVRQCRDNFRNFGFNNEDECRNSFDNRDRSFDEEIFIQEDFRVRDCRDNFRNRGFNNFNDCRNNRDNRNRFEEEIIVEEDFRSNNFRNNGENRFRNNRFNGFENFDRFDFNNFYNNFGREDSRREDFSPYNRLEKKSYYDNGFNNRENRNNRFEEEIFIEEDFRRDGCGGCRNNYRDFGFNNEEECCNDRRSRFFEEEIFIERDIRVRECRDNFRNRGFNNYDDCYNNYNNRNNFFEEDIIVEEDFRRGGCGGCDNRFREFGFENFDQCCNDRRNRFFELEIFIEEEFRRQGCNGCRNNYRDQGFNNFNECCTNHREFFFEEEIIIREFFERRCREDRRYCNDRRNDDRRNFY